MFADINDHADKQQYTTYPFANYNKYTVRIAIKLRKRYIYSANNP
jgi:hypothetical protein